MAEDPIVRKDEIVVRRLTSIRVPHKLEHEIALLPDCCGLRPERQ
jgi:hypothetical protein